MKKAFTILFLFVILFSSTVTLSIPSAFANGEPANLVLGQSNLNSAVSNLADTTLRAPLTTAIDTSGNLWVVDPNNNRVLRYDAPLTDGQGASIVLGQLFFNSNAVGLDASSLNSPRGLAIDGSDNLWVSDVGNNRILRFPVGGGFSNGQPADVVIGQSDFISGAANPGGVTSDTLSSPQGIFIDEDGKLWVADSGNNRVLRYSTLTTGSSADLVLGQSSFLFSVSGITDLTLDGPNGVTVESVTGNVWVADSGNNRVLKYDAPSSNGEDADLVLGQTDFVSNANNNLAVTANSLNKPQSVAIDGSGNVWVADGSNNRLLFYISPSTNHQAATEVLGHLFFEEGDPNVGGITASSLFSPQHVLVDGSTVWTADATNNRVLRYSTLTTGSAADLVLGQGDFTSNTSGIGGLTSSSQSLPQGVLTDDLGNTWVADTANNRVLKYAPPFIDGKIAAVVLGQPDFTSNAAGFDDASLTSPRDLGIDPDGNIWVADTGNSRIVRFPAGSVTGDSADLVLGQSSFISNLPNQGGVASLSTLSFPRGLLVLPFEDNSVGVAVADTGNDRVLIYFAPSSNGPAANIAFGGSGSPSTTTLSSPTDVVPGPFGNFGLFISDTGNNRVLGTDIQLGVAITVLGQSDFTSNLPNAFGNSAKSLSSPRALTNDGDENLWVTDSGNHRTLIFASPFSDEQAAAGVLGQPDLTSTGSNNGGLSATTQSSPHGVTFDSNGDLWVADTSNNRVLRYHELPDVSDTDGDGVPDSEDDCPDDFGSPQNNGCPVGPPQDNTEVLNAIADAKQMILDAIADSKSMILDAIADSKSMILNSLGLIQEDVDDIQQNVNSDQFGLKEIKREVSIIEEVVTAPVLASFIDTETIDLDGHLSAGDFKLLMDITPFESITGHVAMKVPCDKKNDTDLAILTGVAPAVTPLTMTFVAALSDPGTSCLYHGDIGAGITDIALINNGKNPVNFGPNEEGFSVTITIQGTE